MAIRQCFPPVLFDAKARFAIIVSLEGVPVKSRKARRENARQDPPARVPLTLHVPTRRQ